MHLSVCEYECVFASVYKVQCTLNVYVLYKAQCIILTVFVFVCVYCVCVFASVYKVQYTLNVCMQNVYVFVSVYCMCVCVCT